VTPCQLHYPTLPLRGSKWLVILCLLVNRVNITQIIFAMRCECWGLIDLGMILNIRWNIYQRGALYYKLKINKKTHFWSEGKSWSGSLCGRRREKQRKSSWSRFNENNLFISTQSFPTFKCSICSVVLCSGVFNTVISFVNVANVFFEVLPISMLVEMSCLLDVFGQYLVVDGLIN